MENSVVLEGVSPQLSEGDLTDAVMRHCGNVVHAERLPHGNALFLQFGLENLALLAMGSLCEDLRKSLPSDSWQEQPTKSEKELAGSDMRLDPPWIRPPTSEEYSSLTAASNESRRLDRRQRYLDAGCEPMPDFFEHVFDFADDEVQSGEVSTVSSLEGDTDKRVSTRSSCDPFQIELQIWMYNNGTGSALWSSGLILGECLWQGLVPVQGRRVIELGCGCAAVPSIVAAHIGAAHVVATDFISEVLDSASRHACKHGVEVRRLDWNKYTPRLISKQAIGEKYDVVLWSDVVYTEFGGFLLAHATLAHVLPGAKVVAVVPAEDRPGMAEFEHVMCRAGYKRTSDSRIHDVVAEQAEKRFSAAFPKGSAHEITRLIVWEVANLDD